MPINCYSFRTLLQDNIKQVWVHHNSCIHVFQPWCHDILQSSEFSETNRQTHTGIGWVLEASSQSMKTHTQLTHITTSTISNHVLTNIIVLCSGVPFCSIPPELLPHPSSIYKIWNEMMDVFWCSSGLSDYINHSYDEIICKWCYCLSGDQKLNKKKITLLSIALSKKPQIKRFY